MSDGLPSGAAAVVIGGGVGGASVAYHLAELGLKDVIVLERHDLADGTTWHSAGFIGQLRSSISQTRMIMYSTDLYERLARETGMDPGWRGFTARMVAKSNATVVPLFFDGHTSRLFQIASHLHVTLRMGLLIKEFKKRVDTPVDVVVGQPIGRDVLDPLAGDTRKMMDFLRKATYELSPKPLKSYDYGYEFEERHRA